MRYILIAYKSLSHFSIYYLNFVFSDADLPVLSSKDTQTDGVGDSASNEGTEKTDEDSTEKKEIVKHWSIDRIKKEYRRFNIDLAPKVNLCYKQDLFDIKITLLYNFLFTNTFLYDSFYSHVVNWWNC